MGLDTTHDCWHGPYSSFNRFRHFVAGLARKSFDHDYQGLKPENYQGIWASTPPEIIDVFLGHSDCDGVIKAEHAAALALKLDELAKVAEWELKNLARFSAGLKAAAEAGEDVQFH